MDATFDSVSSTGSTAGTAGDYASRNRINSNSSLIGFKGTEALGNGLAVAWQVESGLQSENGTGSSFNTRDTYVGLAGGFGTVAMGFLTGPSRAIAAKFDVNSGATGIGTNFGLLGKGALAAAGLGGGASPFDQRISNAIAYISPNIGGFSGVLGYSTGFTGVNQGAPTLANFAGKQDSPAGSLKGSTAWTLGLNYENGPIYVGYAYTVVNTTNSGATSADGLGLAGATAAAGVFQKAADNRLGAKYDFGQGTVGLLWDQSNYTIQGGGALGFAGGTALKTSTWFLPVTFNVGSGKIIGQYGKAGNVSSTSNTGAKQFEIGYEYSLSKRTIIKALWTQINNDAGAGYDFLYPVARNNATSTGTGANADADPRGISIGIRHAF